MKPTPDVSIIIALYNSTWVLPRLAENLSQIKGDNVEIVAVDDGSTDGSADVFKELVPNSYVVRQENQGLASALNAGVKIACGKYIQILGHDDTIEPEKLEVQIAFARQEGAEVVWSDWRWVLVDGERIQYCPTQDAKPPGDIVEALLAGWWVPPQAYLISRNAYLDIGGHDESLAVWEDFDLLLRLAVAQKRYAYLPGVFANYHRYVNVKSLSRRNERENLECREKVIRKCLKLLEERGQLTTERKRAAARQLHFVARGTFEYDPQWFKRLMVLVNGLDPNFLARGTLIYRLAVSLCGYEMAETVALVTRRLRIRLGWNEHMSGE